jgi:uncharacterized protein YutE (UPF0331/DUF86 family)
MNKRIRELAEQAEIEEGRYERYKGQDCSLKAYSFLPDQLEKFAELIVKECIDIAQDRANFPGYPPNDVNDIIDEIREHFGVEE